MRRAAVLVLSFCSAVVVIGGLSAGAAYAGDGRVSLNVGSGWVHDPGSPLFDISHIAPGWADARTFQVRNDSDGDAALGLAVTDIVEAENGCNHPESFVDTSCAAAGGELGQELILSVFADPDADGTFETTPRWSGTLHDLIQPLVLSDALPATGVEGVRITAGLPWTSGNETQTDRVSFNLRLTLDGTAGVTVEGTKTTKPPTHALSGPLGVLPFTGSPTQRLLIGSAWLLLAGGFLVLLGRLRRTADAL